MTTASRAEGTMAEYDKEKLETEKGRHFLTKSIYAGHRDCEDFLHSRYSNQLRTE